MWTLPSLQFLWYVQPMCTSQLTGAGWHCFSTFLLEPQLVSSFLKPKMMSLFFDDKSFILLHVCRHQAFPVAAAARLERTTMQHHVYTIPASVLQWSELQILKTYLLAIPFLALHGGCKVNCVIIGHCNHFCYLIIIHKHATDIHSALFAFRTVPLKPSTH